MEEAGGTAPEAGREKVLKEKPELGQNGGAWLGGVYVGEEGGTELVAGGGEVFAETRELG